MQNRIACDQPALGLYRRRRFSRIRRVENPQSPVFRDAEGEPMGGHVQRVSGGIAVKNPRQFLMFFEKTFFPFSAKDFLFPV